MELVKSQKGKHNAFDIVDRKTMSATYWKCESGSYRDYNFSQSRAMDFISYMKQKIKNKGIRQRITEMKDHMYSQSKQAM